MNYKYIKIIIERYKFDKYVNTRDRYLRRFPGEGQSARFTFLFNKKHCFCYKFSLPKENMYNEYSNNTYCLI